MGRDIREVPLSIEALRLWRGMNARVEAETGFREAGIVYLCENQKDIDRHEAWLDQARLYQVSSRMLAPDEVAEVLPGSTRRWPGALYTPTDGRAEPSKAAPAIAEAARRRGAAILTECAVRGLETSGGRVSGVVTEKGRIDCDAVVLAGGAWSRLFCGNNGLDLPQLKVLGSVARTAPLEGAPEVAASASNFAFRKRLDGGYSVSAARLRGGHRARQLPPVLRLPPRHADDVEGSALPRRAALRRGVAGQAALVDGRALALRIGARARPGARDQYRGRRRSPTSRRPSPPSRGWRSPSAGAG